MSVDVARQTLGSLMSTSHDGFEAGSEDESRIPCELRYSREDPLAVTLCFLGGDNGEDVDWIFARELLFEALNKGHAGAGDVQIMKIFYGPNSVERIAFNLSSPDGRALVYFRRKPLATFAEDVEQCLPARELDGDIDIDAELAWLLEQS